MKLIFTSLLLSVLSFSVFAQSDLGNVVNQRSGIHSGNRVKTVFQNAGVVGFPANGGPRGAWIYENNGYIGDVSFMLGVEAKMTNATDLTNATIQSLITKNKGKVFHSVTTSDVDRPSDGGLDKSPTGDLWTFEPKPGYFNSAQQSIAMSDNKNSWPSFWPDKQSDVTDPGWRGSWNGYFGKEPKADQESFYVMDDQADYEFNQAPFNHKPDANRSYRKGMGIDVKVRGMQWSQFLAQDCIFWLYEVKNSSTTDYDKAVVGLLCGTLVGVTGTNAYNEYDDDASFFDVENSIVYTWDFDNDVSRNPRWVTKQVGYVGYAFLESPGNGYDGIDNDRDATTSTYKFKESSFDSTLVNVGDTLIVIANDFTRSRFIVPNVSSFKLITRGMTDSVTIKPGITYLKEGNIEKLDANGNIINTGTNVGPNPNSYDFIDNDFDGLIDENYYVHYRQRKTTTDQVVLFDILSPTGYYNYKKQNGNEFLMIDERRDDGLDNDGDWNAYLDDVGADGVADTGDPGEGDGVPTNGEPNYELTDVHESDQIGLTSFDYFTPAGKIKMNDDESLWQNLRPGYFAVPSNFSNGVPTRGEDGDFTFGSGYFPLLAGKTEFFSFALVYGKDKNDLYNHRKTVQKIYDSNYMFPQPPRKPIVKAVADDNKVTLYWDRNSEESIDPVLKIKDFEGYKIYRSTENNFNDINTITNAYGEKVGYEALAQFDIPKNNVYGLFAAGNELFNESRGYVYYLGDDNIGLAHSYVDTDVMNGKRYFYAVVAYDRGDAAQGIFPSENTKVINANADGTFATDVNTVVITPSGRPSDYTYETAFPLTKVGTSNSKLAVEVIDDTRLKDNNVYEIRFTDTATDGIDNNNNGKIDAADVKEIVPITTGYSVLNTTPQTETFVGADGGNIQIQNFGAYLLNSSVVIKDNNGVVVASNNYQLDALKGKIKPVAPFTFTKDKLYTVTYQSYGIYKSINMTGYPNAPFDASNDVAYDGIRVKTSNYWSVLVMQDSSYFYGENTTFFMSASRQNTTIAGNSYQGINFPYDYEVEFYNQIVDSSYGGTIGSLTRPLRTVQFRVKNKTLNRYSPFTFFTTNARYNKWGGKFSRTDELVILEPIDSNYNDVTNKIYYNSNTKVNGKYLAIAYKLILLNSNPAIADTAVMGTNLKYKLMTTKPFASTDKFTFTAKAGKTDKSAFTNSILDKVQVVPNPYVAFSSIEKPLPPLITSGRGERRIEFRNVPANSKINLFTTSGIHIRTLYDDGSSFTGTYKWDLRTKENLDIAAGIYFYVIESPYGNKEGKIAVIK